MDLYQWIYIFLVFSPGGIPFQLYRREMYAISSHFLHPVVSPEFGLYSLLSSRGFYERSIVRELVGGWYRFIRV
jgi:hypothetical protein